MMSQYWSTHRVHVVVVLPITRRGKGVPRVRTSDRQARRAGDELQEVTLLVGAVVGEDGEQVADGARVVRVAVVDAARLRQVARVPRLAAAAAEQLLQLQPEDNRQLLMFMYMYRYYILCRCTCTCTCTHMYMYVVHQTT